MKTLKLTAIAMAMSAAALAPGAQASVVGDQFTISCSLPRGNVDPTTGSLTSVVPSAVYSVDANNAGGSIIADVAGLSYGSSCSAAINKILPKRVGSELQHNCGANTTAPPIVPTGVWQQAAAYPSTDLVGGAVPTLLTPGGDPTYAVQSFSFTCVDAADGGINDINP